MVHWGKHFAFCSGNSVTKREHAGIIHALGSFRYLLSICGFFPLGFRFQSLTEARPWLAAASASPTRSGRSSQHDDPDDAGRASPLHGADSRLVLMPPSIIGANGRQQGGIANDGGHAAADYDERYFVTPAWYSVLVPILFTACFIYHAARGISVDWNDFTVDAGIHRGWLLFGRFTFGFLRVCWIVVYGLAVYGFLYRNVLYHAFCYQLFRLDRQLVSDNANPELSRANRRRIRLHQRLSAALASWSLDVPAYLLILFVIAWVLSFLHVFDSGDPASDELASGIDGYCVNSVGSAVCFFIVFVTSAPFWLSLFTLTAAIVLAFTTVRCVLRVMLKEVVNNATGAIEAEPTALNMNGNGSGAAGGGGAGAGPSSPRTAAAAAKIAALGQPALGRQPSSHASALRLLEQNEAPAGDDQDESEQKGGDAASNQQRRRSSQMQGTDVEMALQRTNSASPAERSASPTSGLVKYVTLKRFPFAVSDDGSSASQAKQRGSISNARALPDSFAAHYRSSSQSSGIGGMGAPQQDGVDAGDGETKVASVVITPAVEVSAEESKTQGVVAPSGGADAAQSIPLSPRAIRAELSPRGPQQVPSDSSNGGASSAGNVLSPRGFAPPNSPRSAVRVDQDMLPNSPRGGMLDVVGVAAQGQGKGKRSRKQTLEEHQASVLQSDVRRARGLSADPSDDMGGGADRIEDGVITSDPPMLSPRQIRALAQHREFLDGDEKGFGGIGALPLDVTQGDDGDDGTGPAFVIKVDQWFQRMLLAWRDVKALHADVVSAAMPVGVFCYGFASIQFVLLAIWFFATSGRQPQKVSFLITACILLLASCYLAVASKSVRLAHRLSALMRNTRMDAFHVEDMDGLPQDDEEAELQGAKTFSAVALYVSTPREIATPRSAAAGAVSPRTHAINTQRRVVSVDRSQYIASPALNLGDAWSGGIARALISAGLLSVGVLALLVGHVALQYPTCITLLTVTDSRLGNGESSALGQDNSCSTVFNFFRRLEFALVAWVCARPYDPAV